MSKTKFFRYGKKCLFGSEHFGIARRFIFTFFFYNRTFSLFLDLFVYGLKTFSPLYTNIVATFRKIKRPSFSAWNSKLTKKLWFIFKKKNFNIFVTWSSRVDFQLKKSFFWPFHFATKSFRVSFTFFRELRDFFDWFGN